MQIIRYITVKASGDLLLLKITYNREKEKKNNIVLWQPSEGPRPSALFLSCFPMAEANGIPRVSNNDDDNIMASDKNEKK